METSSLNFHLAAFQLWGLLKAKQFLDSTCKDQCHRFCQFTIWSLPLIENCPISKSLATFRHCHWCQPKNWDANLSSQNSSKPCSVKMHSPIPFHSRNSFFAFQFPNHQQTPRRLSPHRSIHQFSHYCLKYYWTHFWNTNPVLFPNFPDLLFHHYTELFRWTLFKHTPSGSLPPALTCPDSILFTKIHQVF